MLLASGLVVAIKVSLALSQGRSLLGLAAQTSYRERSLTQSPPFLLQCLAEKLEAVCRYSILIASASRLSLLGEVCRYSILIASASRLSLLEEICALELLPVIVSSPMFRPFH